MSAHRQSPCPCGLPAGYAACCGRYHPTVPNLPAPTAEALMRSRYSAYAMDLTDYLLATWHASTRPLRLENNPPGLRWLGLEVRHAGVQEGTQATVEFVVRSKLGGRAHRMHEISRFVLEDGRWFYLDGGLR